jgi:hypothetical protein
VVELAEIFRDAGPAYLQRFGDRMLPSHKRVLRCILACRTPALGGEKYFCPRCELKHSVFHSCRDRHCPICQGHEGERWLEKQRKLLLPCEYGFATCTVPADLREFARSHQRKVYSILMRSAALALLEVASDRHFVGGLTGVMAMLLTWSQTMIHHPHVHLVFPIGGLGEKGASSKRPAASSTTITPRSARNHLELHRPNRLLDRCRAARSAAARTRILRSPSPDRGVRHDDRRSQRFRHPHLRVGEPAR